MRTRDLALSQLPFRRAEWNQDDRPGVGPARDGSLGWAELLHLSARLARGVRAQPGPAPHGPPPLRVVGDAGRAKGERRAPPRFSWPATAGDRPLGETQRDHGPAEALLVVAYPRDTLTQRLCQTPRAVECLRCLKDCNAYVHGTQRAIRVPRRTRQDWHIHVG